LEIRSFNLAVRDANLSGREASGPLSHTKLSQIAHPRRSDVSAPGYHSLATRRPFPADELNQPNLPLDILAGIHNPMVVDTLDTTFAALSDPTRRAMIERLSRGPASVHGLTEQFAISQQMISKHIAYLVRAQLVIKRKSGRESVCTLRPEAIKTVSDWAFNYRRFWEESFDKLGEVVKQIKQEEAGDDTRHH
jgi:DNA-binding transcriptional ArsR family regulator